MRLSNKPNIVTGSILLLGAAFFSIALALLPMDFGAYGPGSSSSLYTTAYNIGEILFSVYGFSSILIPVFLFIAGISCFASRWTARKSMRLLTAVVPFFTSVIIEKICRAMLEYPDDFTSIKVALTVSIGAFLVAIEILTAGLIADRVNDRLFHSGNHSDRDDDDFFTEDSGSTKENSETVAEETTPAEPAVVIQNAMTKTSNTTEQAEPAVPGPFDHIFDEPAVEAAEADSTKAEETVSVQAENTASNEETDEVPAQEPLLSKEEYDALNRINEELIETKADETQPSELIAESAEENLELPEEEQIEWPSTDEIISQAGITKSEELSLLGDKAGDESEPDRETSAFTEEAEKEEDSFAAETEETSEYDGSDFTELNNADESDSENSYETEESSESRDELYDVPEIPENSDGQEESDPYTDFGFDQTETSESSESYDSDGYFDNSENPYSDAEFINSKTQKKTENTLDPDFFDIDMNEEEPDTDDAIEQKRSFLDDMVDAQEDDDDFEGHFAESESAEEDSETSDETEAASEESEFSDSDEDDFGRTSSTFNIASDIFADMEEDAREQIESGKKPSRFAQPEYDAAMNPSAPESADSDDGGLADSESAGTMSGIETAEPPARTTVATEPKPLGNRAKPKKPYIVPTDLLEQYEDDQYWIIDDQTKNDAVKLKDTLNQFGIEAEVIGIKKGPVVTMFELAPAPGVKLSKIVSLQDNIALSLAASSVRIVAPIPGKAAVGIEIPNKKRSIVSFREMIEQDLPEFKKMAVPVILGKDILGKSQIIDIAKTPHLLIAGATGAGKSVCVNSLILSILYKRSPREVKMILVDPKVVELKLYNDIPHLLTPVITEPKKALQALQYCLCEMERRYALLDGMGVRDISNYNKRIEERHVATEKLPYIVVIIDEFADLMATSGRDLESIVARLTAMSRAVGIHLVLATQRPSVNVITGLIKANIPSRIAFMVSSRTDSNIIIDSVGAEKLLGKGDMLYASAVDPYPVRIQGTFESDNDVENVVNYVKTLGEPEYIDDEIFIEDEEDEEASPNLFSDGDDPLYEQALDIVIQAGKASASYIQRRLKIGYNRAARLVEEMEARGIVGPANGSKPREVIHVPS